MEATTRFTEGRSVVRAVSAARRIRRAGPWVAVIAAAAMAGGCKDKNETPVSLAPRAVPFLSGVPVPEGFKIHDRRTNASESGGIRYAWHEYTGFADRYEVSVFYKENMPKTGWTLVSLTDIKGRISIRFESRNEECTLTIEGGDWGILQQTTIQAIIKPFSRTHSEPPVRRPMP